MICILGVVVVHLLSAAPALVWTKYLDSPFGFVVVAPYFAPYIVNFLGVPGLLEHNGACGWGWCPPTIAGWGLILGVWFLGVLLLAWIIKQLVFRHTS